MKKKLSVTEQLQYSTFRIEGIDQQGYTMTGTGFLFNLMDKDNDRDFPIMVTNKHVIESLVEGRIVFTLADSYGNPIDSLHQSLSIAGFKDYWEFHPNPEIDLCAASLLFFLSFIYKKGREVFYRLLTQDNIPTAQDLLELDAVEDIIMVGYPDGLWDEVNNQPIIRKGITATHPNKDYEGKREFVADIAAFPGSSGSPVLVYDNNIYKSKHGDVTLGRSRFLLLGILYAGPQQTVIGDIVSQPIIAQNKILSIHSSPMNLGFVIKSEMLLDFKDIFFNRYQ